MRPLLVLVPTLAAAILATGEPLTATAWDVRKDATELLDEIARSHGEPGDVLVRAQAMIAAHGSELVSLSPTEAAPLAVAIAVRLQAAGLSERFAAEIGPGAERRLAELIAASAGPGELVSFARGVPGTNAAVKAWQRAADLAWDRGLLRLHGEAAMAAGSVEAGRVARLTAARSLLSGSPSQLPATLDGLDAMWRIATEVQAKAVAQPANGNRRRNRQVAAAQRPGAGLCGAGAIAYADGQSLTVVDHLVDVQQGARIALGDRPLPPYVSRPEAVPGGAVAVGVSEGRILLVCADAAGTERWRHSGETDGVDAIGAPVALDSIVAVPYRTAGEDRLELRLLAVSTRDGHPLWDIVIGHLATPRWGSDNLAPPSAARHARGLMVCSNAGALALVGSDGTVRRLWSYPTRNDMEMEGTKRGRRGLSAGDGRTAVATPADHAGLVLVLGADESTLKAYRGDGADGDVLAVENGEALIAGRQIALVDVTKLSLRWTAPLRLPEAQGLIGSENMLVAGTDQLALLKRSDGTMTSGRALESPAAVSAADGVLILAESAAVRGFGDAAAFLTRLRETAAKSGDDPRPHAALGAVLAGRNEIDAALASWTRALELGAGPGIAERTARLLRARIETGGPTATTALQQMAGLDRHLPGIGDEVHLWRGRLAEAAGDKATASGHYAAVLTAPDRLLNLGDGITISSRVLAGSGLARCGGPPYRILTTPAAMAPSQAGSTWSTPARIRGRAVIAGGTVCAFADGLLRAWSLTDGSRLWQRKPQRALLGVTAWREKAEDGVAIAVLPGSAGDAAGLIDGDVLLSLNGTAIRDFDAQLRPMVAQLGGGTAFTFQVRGKNAIVRTITGNLGGEPIEPIASDGSIILARTTMALAPGRSDLRVFAIDARTGADLWSQVLSQDEERLARSLPVLAGSITVAADGPDLVGIDHAGTVMWRHSNRSELLAQASMLGRCLWMPTAVGDGVVLDPANGAELARVPAADGEPPALSGSLLAVRSADERIAIWDLATGRLRCRTVDPARTLTLRSDALLALDTRNRPVVIDIQNGSIRRVLYDAPCEAQSISADQAFLAVAGADRRTILAIDLDGCVTRWSLDLPPGLEIEALRPAGGNGLLAVLREGTRTWGLLLDDRGMPTAVTGWPTEPGGDATPLGTSAVIVDGSNIRILTPAPSVAPPALACVKLDPAKPVRTAMNEVLPKLAWQGTQGPSIAAAKHGPLLILALRGLVGDTPLRLADASGPIAMDASRSMVSPGGTRLAVPGGWSLAEHWTIPDPSGGPSIAMSAWAPLPSHAPGTPVVVLMGDHPTQPWWLASNWTRITDAP